MLVFACIYYLSIRQIQLNSMHTYRILGTRLRELAAEKQFIMKEQLEELEAVNEACGQVVGLSGVLLEVLVCTYTYFDMYV
jgi:hypothetical protein